MKIIFNCLDSGLGPNGGSRTIVRSANILKKMGHYVCILNPEPKRLKLDQYRESAYTWDHIDVPVLHSINPIESADVIIATAFASVESTIKAPKRLGIKAHWIRGWETWRHSEDWIKNNVLNQPTIKIVNSIGMQDKLKEFNVDSTIIRPGYDINELYPMDVRKNNKVITLGCLYSKGDKRSTKRVDWIFKAVKEIKKKMNVSLIMFGGEGDPPKDAPFDLFSPNPNSYVKNSLYNQIDIWIAPTCNDSNHLPPAEAMLTECCIVGTDAPMNGMKDYLINAETGTESFNTYESFRDCIIYSLLVGEETRIKYGKAAREKILSLGTREENMNKLIKYLEDNI
jgi:glycosyltransferase involved in cell wall biosynthesis